MHTPGNTIDPDTDLFFERRRHAGRPAVSNFGGLRFKTITQQCRQQRGVGGEIGYLFVEMWARLYYDYVDYYGKVAATGRTITVRC